MFEVIRKRQRILLTIFTILVIVAFGFLYNPSSRLTGAGGGVMKVNGRNVTMEELQRLGRLRPLISALGQSGNTEIGEMAVLLGGRGARDSQNVIFVANLIILRDESRRLQFEPSRGQIGRLERELSIFQKDGKFDPTSYQQFVDEFLKRNGYTAADLDEVISDYSRLKDYLAILEATAPLPESFFRQQYERLNRVQHFATVRFNRADFDKNVQVTDQEKKQYYDDHKAEFNTDEKRKIALVRFPFSEEQKKMGEEERRTATKALRERAQDFVQPLYDHPEAFGELAKSKDLKVEETGFFADSQTDPLLAKETALSAQIAQLTEKQPVDVVEGKDGYYVIKLANVEPSRPLTFEEASSAVTARLRDEKIRRAITEKANSTRSAVVAAIKGGASFSDAVQKMGLKADTPLPFKLADASQENSVARLLAENQLTLEPGQTSKPLFDQNGNGVLLHLSGQDPVDEKGYEDYRSKYFAQAKKGYVQAILEEWLREEQRKAGVAPALASAVFSH